MTPAEQLADNILKASGSGMRHYSMVKTREAIIAEAQKPLDQIKNLTETLENIVADIEMMNLQQGFAGLIWSIVKAKQLIKETKAQE